MASSGKGHHDGVEISAIGVLHRGPLEKKYWSSSRGKEKYPYPVGYQATRWHGGHRYLMEVSEGARGPLFVVTCEEGIACSGQTPSVPWEDILKKRHAGVKKIQMRSSSTSVDGPEMFGFTNPLVQRLCRDLLVSASGLAERSGVEGSSKGKGSKGDTPAVESGKDWALAESSGKSPSKARKVKKLTTPSDHKIMEHGSDKADMTAIQRVEHGKRRHDIQDRGKQKMKRVSKASQGKLKDLESTANKFTVVIKPELSMEAGVNVLFGNSKDEGVLRHNVRTKRPRSTRSKVSEEDVELERAAQTTAGVTASGSETITMANLLSNRKRRLKAQANIAEQAMKTVHPISSKGIAPTDADVVEDSVSPGPEKQEVEGYVSAKSGEERMGSQNGSTPSQTTDTLDSTAVNDALPKNASGKKKRLKLAKPDNVPPHSPAKSEETSLLPAAKPQKTPPHPLETPFPLASPEKAPPHVLIKPEKSPPIVLVDPEKNRESLEYEKYGTNVDLTQSEGVLSIDLMCPSVDEIKSSETKSDGAHLHSTLKDSASSAKQDGVFLLLEACNLAVDKDGSRPISSSRDKVEKDVQKMLNSSDVVSTLDMNLPIHDAFVSHAVRKSPPVQTIGSLPSTDVHRREPQENETEGIMQGRHDAASIGSTVGHHSAAHVELPATLENIEDGNLEQTEGMTPPTAQCTELKVGINNLFLASSNTSVHHKPITPATETDAVEESQLTPVYEGRKDELEVEITSELPARPNYSAEYPCGSPSAKEAEKKPLVITAMDSGIDMETALEKSAQTTVRSAVSSVPAGPGPLVDARCESNPIILATGSNSHKKTSVAGVPSLPALLPAVIAVVCDVDPDLKVTAENTPQNTSAADVPSLPVLLLSAVEVATKVDNGKIAAAEAVLDETSVAEVPSLAVVANVVDPGAAFAGEVILEKTFVSSEAVVLAEEKRPDPDIKFGKVKEYGPVTELCPTPQVDLLSNTPPTGPGIQITTENVAETSFPAESQILPALSVKKNELNPGKITECGLVTVLSPSHKVDLFTDTLVDGLDAMDTPDDVYDKARKGTLLLPVVSVKENELDIAGISGKIMENGVVTVLSPNHPTDLLADTLSDVVTISASQLGESVTDDRETLNDSSEAGVGMSRAQVIQVDTCTTIALTEKAGQCFDEKGVSALMATLKETKPDEEVSFGKINDNGVTTVLSSCHPVNPMTDTVPEEPITQTFWDVDSNEAPIAVVSGTKDVIRMSTDESVRGTVGAKLSADCPNLPSPVSQKVNTSVNTGSEAGQVVEVEGHCHLDELQVPIFVEQPVTVAVNSLAGKDLISNHKNRECEDCQTRVITKHPTLTATACGEESSAGVRFPIIQEFPRGDGDVMIPTTKLDKEISGAKVSEDYPSLPALFSQNHPMTANIVTEAEQVVEKEGQFFLTAEPCINSGRASPAGELKMSNDNWRQPEEFVKSFFPKHPKVTDTVPEEDLVAQGFCNSFNKAEETLEKEISNDLAGAELVMPDKVSSLGEGLMSNDKSGCPLKNQKIHHSGKQVVVDTLATMGLEEYADIMKAGLDNLTAFESGLDLEEQDPVQDADVPKSERQLGNLVTTSSTQLTVSSREQSEKDESESMTGELTTSMLTLLLPQAVPLLKKGAKLSVVENCQHEQETVLSEGGSASTPSQNTRNSILEPKGTDIRPQEHIAGAPSSGTTLISTSDSENSIQQPLVGELNLQSDLGVKLLEISGSEGFGHIVQKEMAGSVDASMVIHDLRREECFIVGKPSKVKEVLPLCWDSHESGAQVATMGILSSNFKKENVGHAIDVNPNLSFAQSPQLNMTQGENILGRVENFSSAPNITAKLQEEVMDPSLVDSGRHRLKDLLDYEGLPSTVKHLNDSKKMESALCIDHSLPVLAMVLNVRGNDIRLCVICGFAESQERTFFVYQVLREGNDEVKPPLLCTVTSSCQKTVYGTLDVQIPMEESAVRFSPDGQQLLLLDCFKLPQSCEHASYSNINNNGGRGVNIISFEKEVVQVSAHLQSEDLMQCLVVPGPQLLIAAGDNGCINCWEMDSGWRTCKDKFSLPRATCDGDPFTSVTRLTVMPGLPHMVLGCDYGGFFALWDTRSRTLLSSCHLPNHNVLKASWLDVTTISLENAKVLGKNQSQVHPQGTATVDSFSAPLRCLLTMVSCRGFTLNDKDDEATKYDKEVREKDTEWSCKTVILKSGSILCGPGLLDRVSAVTSLGVYGVMGTTGGLVQLWEVASGQKICELNELEGSSIVTLATNPSSAVLATANGKGQVILYFEKDNSAVSIRR